jgi:hypothetical protein
LSNNSCCNISGGRNFYIRAEKYGSSINAEEYGSIINAEEYGSSINAEEYGSSINGEEYGSSINAEEYGSTRASRREWAGIHLTCALNRDEKDVIKSSSECGEILMKDLIETLTAHTPHYGLLSRNCWDYARGTYDRLLKWFK